MNAFSPSVDRVALRKAQAVSALELVCRELEPTLTQRELAQQHYEAVGGWVADAPHHLFKSTTIYAQGSHALGTAIRPVGRDEFDVDLVVRFATVSASLPPAGLKRVLGDRLAAHATYAPMLEEMPRCWRLNYAGQFHLDFTPSIPNPRCANGGELVPDRKLSCWKPTNPQGYQERFEQRARLLPRMRLQKSMVTDGARADLQPFPQQLTFKGPLRRIVQLAKRHRDVFFQAEDEALRPISVIITTLASRAYEVCAEREYENEFDLLLDVVRLMPAFIDERRESGGVLWYIWNETTAGENFAEKWNREPARAEAFFIWHGRFVSQLDALIAAIGLDGFAKGLAESFGRKPVSTVIEKMNESVNAARRTGKLVTSPTAGLVVAPALAAGVKPIRANTFFGTE